MEKLNNILFKTGKNISTILCIIFLLIIACSFIGFCISFKPVKMEYPQYSLYVSEKKIKEGDSSRISDTRIKNYYRIIEDIAIQNNYNKYGKEVILDAIKPIEESKREEFVTGLKPFLFDYQQELNRNKKEGKVNELVNVISDYQDIFISNYQDREFEKLRLVTLKYICLSTIISSILFFILCLILPILLKIEENTRK